MLQSLFGILLAFWWVIVPLFLILFFLDVWLHWRRLLFENSLEWELLELTIPKDVLQTPKAMEQVFASVHASYSGGIGFQEKWLAGKLEDWYSFELIGRAHHFHFFIWTQTKYRNLVETAIYAQYPDAEITVAQDYVNEFQPRLPDQTYDFWGADYILAKDNALPIRTYPFFEESVEERRIDPIASITEVMSQLKDSEAIWLQLLIRPTGTAWADAYKESLEKKAGRGKRTLLEELVNGLGHFFRNLLVAIAVHPSWPEEKEGEAKEPKPVEIPKEVEDKMSKLAFEAAWRFIYIDERDKFTKSNITAVNGALRQFNAPKFNSFKPNSATATSGKGIFKNYSLQRRKRFLFDNYRIRHFPNKWGILTVEELATIYHPPITAVKAPMLRRVESRKGHPPAGLPVLD